MSRIARVGAGLVVGCIFSVLTVAAAKSAEPLKGADAALEALRDPKAKEPKGIGPILFRDIQRFEEEGAKLPADAAAKQWLELLSRYEALPPGANIIDPQLGETLDLDTLLRSL